MTRIEKTAAINEIINGQRGALALSKGAEAYINDAGQIRYRDQAAGYSRRISFSELLSYLHGEDARAMKRIS